MIVGYKLGMPDQITFNCRPQESEFLDSWSFLPLPRSRPHLQSGCYDSMLPVQVDVEE